MKAKQKPKLPPYVVLKKGEWHIRVSFPTHIRDARGKIVYEQMTRRCFPETEERAAEIAEYLISEYKHRTQPASPTATIGDYIARYLQSKKRSITERTFGYYEYLYTRHIKDTSFGATFLADATALTIQQFYDRLQSAGSSPSRVRKLHTLLSMAFRQAVIWELADRNPCDGVMLPKAQRNESAAMSADEARRFITVCRQDDRFIMFELALETGLRPQEILALRWQDIDLSRRRIAVRQAVTQTFQNTSISIKSPKTESSKRTVGFSPELKERLLRQRDIVTKTLDEIRAKASAPAATRKKVKGVNYQRRRTTAKTAKAHLIRFEHFDLVFPSENGGPKQMANVNRREFKEALRLAGIDQQKYSFKNLRHTCASLLAEMIQPKKLQRLLGHSELNTTMRYYVHVDDESLFDSSDRLRALLAA